jgi:hypothetical protein
MKLSLFANLYLSTLSLPSAFAQLSDGTLQEPPELSNNGGDLTIDLSIAAGSHSTIAATPGTHRSHPSR